MKKVFALLLITALGMAAGCTTVSKITTTYNGPDGNPITVVQELTDEAVFVQAQKDAIKPIVCMESIDPSKPIKLENVKKFEVYAGGGASNIRQYIHPGWSVLNSLGGGALSLGTAYVSLDGATKLVGAVGAVAGTRISGSFNGGNGPSAINYAPGNSTGNTNISPSDRHDTTDSHDISEMASE